jgi:hypothetical protein
MAAKAPAPVVMLLAAIALAGCAPRVAVMPSGTGVGATPKARDCRIDFFRTRVGRPYEEFAALHVEGSSWDGPEDLQEAIRTKACALGADAVVVTQEFLVTQAGGIVHVTMNGAAIRYRDSEPADALPR